jgi:starch phosphorylase
MMPLESFALRTRIAYFSMEIALRPEIHTYAGGLGVLAGDTARSCADLGLPVVFVTLASRAGYFRQEIDAEGRQVERPDWWDPGSLCTPLNAMAAVDIGGKPVWIRPWLYVHTYPLGHQIPVILLDTGIEENEEADRTLTQHLYGGGDEYRLKQEIILGIGGLRVLRALGFEPHTYHLNEGHAALLALDLLNRRLIEPGAGIGGEGGYELTEVRARCVFTTHTPVEAGHDRFPYALFERLMPDFADPAVLRRLAGDEDLNMTRLALSLTGYVNGVARRHAETTQQMFPGYRIHAITNGVHVGTWTHQAFGGIYDRTIPAWRHEPEQLVRALQIPSDEVWRAHVEAKSALVHLVGETTGVTLDPDALTIGFARRMTGYKRPGLLFQDVDRLVAMAQRHKFQVVLAGKAHPKDEVGREAVYELHQLIQRLAGRVTCVFLPNYDMRIAAAMVAGADLWLNTPLPPMEASGTSGMKAALNGVLNLSVLDGWWIEACIEGVTGWAIGDDDGGERAKIDATSLYEKLEQTILPLYYEDPAGWRERMKQSIAYIGSYFNSHRMMRRYAVEAYLR